MTHLVKPLFLIFMLFVSGASVAAGNDYQQTVDKLLSNTQTPVGVVFEVVSRDKRFLERALPEISRLTKKIRKRFPGLDIVLVTHGREMFSLTKASQEKNPAVKSRISSLLADDVTVHVCGTYAAWEGVEPSEFPESINVAAAGPTQINDYVGLGYTLIKIKKLD